MNYKDLMVWQKSISLVKTIYKIIKLLPKDELYGLSDQIRRSAVSIPSNIAEGFERNSIKEYIHFLYIALGSSSELETQLIICKEIGFIQEIDAVTNDIDEIKKMLNGLISSLKRKI